MRVREIRIRSPIHMTHLKSYGQPWEIRVSRPPDFWMGVVFLRETVSYPVIYRNMRCGHFPNVVTSEIGGGG